MANNNLVPIPENRALTNERFLGLANVPTEIEWFANITNPKTRRAYEVDTRDFMTYTGIIKPEEFRIVTRAHVIAWRQDLEKRNLAPITIRRKLSAISSLFDYLCEANAIMHNPVKGVQRPKADTNEGKTPAISDAQARKFLDAPPSDTLKGLRDRAVLATFLFHGLRCEELCSLRVKDVHERRGVMHLRIFGKGGKMRFVPAHPAALERINAYLTLASHRDDKSGPLFRPVKNPRTGDLTKPLSSTSIYRNVVKHYAINVGVNIEGFCTHFLRATATTNALENAADIAKVQEWLGHMPTFLQQDYMTAVRAVQKKARRLRWGINSFAWKRIIVSIIPYSVIQILNKHIVFNSTLFKMFDHFYNTS